QPRQGIISLDTAGFVIDSIFFVVLFGELFLDGPWSRPHGRIFDHDLVFERGWPGAGPALDEAQVLARPPKISSRTEVRHVDDQRIAFPVATRIAKDRKSTR